MVVKCRIIRANRSPAGDELTGSNSGVAVVVAFNFRLGAEYSAHGIVEQSPETEEEDEGEDDKQEEDVAVASCTEAGYDEAAARQAFIAADEYECGWMGDLQIPKVGGSFSVCVQTSRPPPSLSALYPPFYLCGESARVSFIATQPTHGPPLIMQLTAAAWHDHNIGFGASRCR